MDPRKQYTSYDMYNGPPSRNNMPAISSSMAPYNGHVAAPSARRGNGNYNGNFGRGGYSSHGGSGGPIMSRGGGGKRGGMTSRGGHHRGPKPVLDQNNNYMSYSSSPYQGGYQQQQQQQQQQPIVPFHQRANEYNVDGGMNMSYPGPTVPDTSYYHAASTTQSRTTRKENYHWDSKRSEDAERITQQIEQRAARERPCRTLFVRNVQYEARKSDVMEMFSQYGEIKDIFDLIEQRGMVFVTFYDIRAAEHAKQQTQGAQLCGRKIDVHYSLPKEEDQHSKCGRTSNQGTLLFTLNNTKEWLQDDVLYPYLSQFGQVKVIRIPQFRNQTYGRRQRFVEYYDSRACIEAYDACHDQPYGDGVWDVTFFWDHTTKEKSDKPDHPPGNRMDTHAPSTRYGAEKKRRLSDDDFQRNRRRRRNGQQPTAPRDPRINHHRDTSSSSSHNRQMYGETQSQSSEYSEEMERMEKAQKAQELLSKITQTPAAASPPSNLPPQSQPTMFNSPPAPSQQQQLTYSMPTNIPTPAPTSQPVAAQPTSATPDQQAQLRELLDLLMVAQQQQQQQMQQQQQVTQPTVPVVPAIPTTQQPPPQAVPTDPNAALAQLAQVLQNQQQQQLGTATSQPTAPSYNGGYGQYQPPGPGQ